MIAILKLAVYGAFGLTVVYFLAAAYARSVRREFLEKSFDAGGIAGDRDSYIAEGMRHYERGLKYRLLWLVYIIPMVVVVATAYVVNHS